MNQDRFNKIDSLLEDVIDLPTLEREEFLDERCRDDVSLKGEVLELLDSLKDDDDFLENSKLKNVNEFFADEKPNDFIGKKIGAYQLKELIGRGGMSAVYLASRIDDFEKEVAVKIIPPFDNRQTLADNFLRERQILANLSHPYIAQILDGGTTSEGKPYLVMEYVDGVPLDEFCETNNLSESEILELFRKVCQAVTFAHSNFIVHRDLKPQNILITEDGTPKLLDFGIAKLLDDENSLFSDKNTFDGNALTLEYASPEQITGGNITVASDVYSLGVILYKLLTGKKPRDLKDKSLAEIVDDVTTAEPVAPSQVGTNKSITAKSEIDYITLKSLANSPKERYKSVEEFEQDIKNYLDNVPISARPATRFYRFKKYVRRRKIEVAAASVLVLILFGWLATSLFQLRTSRETARKNREAAYSAEMILAAKEYENANLARVTELVNRHIPQDNQEDIRGFEWYFLNNLVNSLGKLKTLPHKDEVWAVTYSPDGKLLASASNDNIVRIWNIAEEKVIIEIEQNGAWEIAFFPDGKRFAVASSSKKNPIVKVYETESGSEVYTLSGHKKRVRAVAVSPDGKWLVSGGFDGDVIFWNAEDGTEIKRFSIPLDSQYGRRRVRNVTFSPDGSKLLVSGHKMFCIIDTINWSLRLPIDKLTMDRTLISDRWKVAHSPTEDIIGISTFTGIVFLLDSNTLKVIRRLKLHDLNIKSLVFSTDGKHLITASWDRTIKFVNVATGEVIHELLGHTGGVHDISISPDGKTFATASADFKVHLWDTNKILQNSAIQRLGDANVYDKKENVIYFSLTEAIRKINLDSRKVVWKQKVEHSDSSIDFSAKTARVVLAGKDGIIFLLNAQTGEIVRGQKVADSGIRSIKFSPDGKRLYVGYEDGFLWVLETESYKVVNKIKIHEGIFRALDVSPDGNYLVTGGDDKLVKIIDANNGEILQNLAENTKPLYEVAFSPDGEKILAAGADSLVRLWRMSDGELLQKMMVVTGYSVAFSPDGKRIATGSANGVIRLWKTETGQEVLAFTTKQKRINNIFFSADGKKLMSIGEKLNIWNGG